MQTTPNDQNNFFAVPKVVKAGSKYRVEQKGSNNNEVGEGEISDKYYNLMWDKRVVRGNTYASVITDKPQEPSPKKNKKIEKVIKETKDDIQTHIIPPNTPRPLPGREHVKVETDEFVETLTDKPPHYSKEVQTEFNIETTPPRHYLPVKTGINKETQIWDGDIFDFDYEVEPILQVLLGKTLELSRMEVLQEQELLVMKQQQNHYDELKNLENQQTKMLEQKENDLMKEIEDRKYKAKKTKEINIKSHSKIVSRNISKKFLSKIKDNTLNKLEILGIFRPALETSMYSEYLPWLIKNIENELNTNESKSNQFKTCLQEIQDNMKKIHIHKVNIYVDEMERRRNEEIRIKIEKEEQRKKRIEEKKRKAELKRRQELKNEIQEKFVNKAELKNNWISLILSDMDGSEKETPFIGLFGGVLGELIIFFNILDNIAKEETIKNFGQVFVKKFEKFLVSCLTVILSSTTFDITISDLIIEDLQKIDETLVLETLNNGTLDSEKIGLVFELLRKNLASPIINSFIRNSELFNLNESIIEEIIRIVLKFSLENENGKNIKFVKVNKQNSFEKKLALCKIHPPLEELTMKDEFQEKKEPKALNTNRSKDSDKKDQSEIQEPIPHIEGLFEAELEDKFSMFTSIYEETRILILHNVAQELIKREWLSEIKADCPELNGLEYQILKILAERSKEIEDLVLEVVGKKLDIINYETY